MANYVNSKTSSKSQSPTYNNGPRGASLNLDSPRLNDFVQGTGESISLRREAFNRKQFDDTVNTEFVELGVSTTPDPATFDPSLATVGDFFNIYETLFYQIPKEGDVNSHTFLIRESTEYTLYVSQQEEIDALLEEINLLRLQNLDLVKDMTNTINQLSTTFDVNNSSTQ